MNEFPFPHFPAWGNSLRASDYIIGFCGNIYPVIELRTNSLNDTTKFCFNLEEVDAFIRENFKEKQIAGYLTNKKRKYKVYGWCYSQTQYKFKEFFDLCQSQKSNFRELFEKEHSPLFVAKSRSNNKTITYNTSLKDYEFFRVFDPYQAFQEISMFLGGLAVPLKEVPVPDDKTMAEIKGFDKFSFRKDPKISKI